MMEERWWPLLWLAGAALGYALFMRYHPLRAPFDRAFAFARTNVSIIAGLAVLMIATVLWRYWQEIGLSSENTVALALDGWRDLMDWLPFANEDLRTIFWYCVPLDVAFLMGTPILSLTAWYWIPRLWRACREASGTWMAGMVLGLFALSLWWWLQRVSEVAGLPFRPVPALNSVRHLLTGVGEIVFATLLVCFIQSVLLLGAYRSHGAGASPRQLKIALDWGLKCFPRMLPIPAVVLVAMGINWLAEDRLEFGAAPVWNAFKGLVFVATAAVPVCLLLLQDLKPWEAVQASFRFLLRTSWRFFFFLFICLSHFFLVRLIESYLQTSVLTGEVSVLLSYLVTAVLRAGLIIWFVNAFCLYFCIDVSQRQTTKKPQKSMKLATLQARLRRRRPFARS